MKIYGNMYLSEYMYMAFFNQVKEIGIEHHSLWEGTAFVKEKGLAPVFLDLRLEHPAGWICARYKSYHYYYYYWYLVM